MEFPSHHHPVQRCYELPHRRRFHYYGTYVRFADYGSYGRLTVQQDGSNITYIPQKCHIQPGELRYSAQHPSLPLLSTPAQADYPFKDRISSARLDRQKQLRRFIKLLLLNRGKTQLCRAAWDKDPTIPEKNREVGALINEVKSQLEEALANQDVPAQLTLMDKFNHTPWVMKCVKEYKDTGGLGHLEAVNWSFTGGCLATAKRGDNHLLIHPSGADWDHLALTSVREKDQGFLQADKLSTLQAPGTVYELHSQAIHNQVLCALRVKDSCSLYDVRESETTPTPSLHHLGNEVIDSPSSVCLSPYIPAEVLVATENGDAVLWTPGKSKEVVVRSRAPRFECEEAWRQCQFGAHPRLITMADRSMLQLHDIRTGCVSDMDLFALPHMAMYKDERIQVTSAHPRVPFYHLVASDFLLLLIDQRFPGHPVFQWNHMLKFPQYLSAISDPLDGEDDLVLMGSQLPAETFAFKYKLGSAGLPPQSTSVPWRISRMDDFSLFPGLSGVVSDRVRKERFTSLAGIALFNNSNTAHSFTALQLDCHGDVFYQCYDKRALSGEITQAAGPGSTELRLCDQVVKKGTVWLKGLEAQADSWFLETRAIKKQKLWDVSESFTVVTQQKYAHVLCPLCMPQTCDPGVGAQLEDPGGSDQSLDGKGRPEASSTGDEDDLCHVCGYTLGVTRSLVQSNLQDEVVNTRKESCDWDVLLPTSTELMGCQLPLSRMLTKEWNGETDITELLVAHDKFLTSRNQELIRERKEELKAEAAKEETQSGLLATLLQKVKKSPGQSSPTSPMEERNETGRNFATPSRSRTPSQCSTPPRPSTLPGFGSTPVRLVSRQNSSASERSHKSSLSPKDAQLELFKAEPLFEFLSQKDQRRSRTISPRAKRRKKHVSGF